ncbi:Mobile element protein [methanotrophic endosymbiont of Bathymodiolus azoricus (Menez Gwen)]|nr:Mobile element protein [methanotrophic endosymbiont of Bathymodiolus azoricus (Menez Gwen)]
MGLLSHLWVNSDIIPLLFPNVHKNKIMISFKGTHFPKDVILYAVFFYVRYGVSLGAPPRAS